MIKFNSKVLKYDGKWLNTNILPPLPQSTARFRFSDPTYDPRTEDRWSSSSAAARWSKVQVADNVWDYTSIGGLVSFASSNQSGVKVPGIWNDRNFNVELLDTNMYISDIIIYDFTNSFEKCNNFIAVHKISTKPHHMRYTFAETSISTIPMFDASELQELQGAFMGCSNLETVPNLYTPNIWNLSWALNDCPNLRALPNWNTEHVTTFDYFCCNIHVPNNYIEEIPDYDVSSARTLERAFSNLPNVKVGMYRLYQKLVALGDQVTNHVNVFAGTGINTQEGMAERALIPQSWGGDLVEE